jgi:hypothetical protein
MTSLEDLKSVLRRLSNKNCLMISYRTKVFTAFDSDVTGKPKLSNENMIINEMIREYL